MIYAWLLALIRALKVRRYLDDVWLGKELHDWLLIVPLAATRLVSKKPKRRCLAII